METVVMQAATVVETHADRVQAEVMKLPWWHRWAIGFSLVKKPEVK